METQTTTLERIPETSSFSLQSFDHAQRVAKMLSTSNLVPKDYQGRIENCMIALEMANRIGASPLMVMQNLHIIQGKPSWSSPFIIATLNSCGRFAPMRFEKTGTPDTDEYGCEAWTHDKTGKKLTGPKVTWKMVKEEGWLSKPGSKWKTMPELMFMYRSAAFFGRLYAPDIMMGMHTQDEVIDMTHNGQMAAENFDQMRREIDDLFLGHDLTLTEKEVVAINRVLDNNETASYSKVLNLLKSRAK